MQRKSIGEYLASLRRSKNLTQQQVADQLGISNRTLSNWETGKSFPDITLLPVLADLYGVSADEIVRAGSSDQPQQDAKELSEQSLVRMLKSRHTRFITYTYILCTVLCASVVLMFCYLFFDYTVGLSFSILGIVAFIVTAGVLIAVTIGAWNAQEGDDKISGSYRLCVAHTVLLSYCFSALFLLILGLTLLFMSASLGETFTGIVSAFILAAALGLVLAGELLSAHAIKRYGTDEQRAAKQGNDKLYAKTARFGSIPFLIALTCVFVCSTWSPDKRDVRYSGDADVFIAYVETLVVPQESYLCFERGVTAGEYPLDLSGRLTRGEYTKSGNIILLEIPLDKEMLHAQIIEGDTFLYLYFVESNGEERQMCVTQITEIGGVTFYPIRTERFLNEFLNGFVAAPTENVFYESHDFYEYNEKDGVYTCEYVTSYDIRGLGVITGGLIFAIDLIVCTVVCLCKRKQINPKIQR